MSLGFLGWSYFCRGCGFVVVILPHKKQPLQWKSENQKTAVWYGERSEKTLYIEAKIVALQTGKGKVEASIYFLSSTFEVEWKVDQSI